MHKPTGYGPLTVSGAIKRRYIGTSTRMSNQAELELSGSTILAKAEDNMNYKVQVKNKSKS